MCQYPPGQFEWPMNIGYWHLPTQIYPLKGIHPYDHADLFAIVRDPDDRLLSEFYYICRRKISVRWDGSACNRTRVHEPSYMNHWMQTRLRRSPTDHWGTKDYLDENGHFTPQYEFIVADGEIRMVDHVLRMDNLNQEFPALMKAYGLEAALPVDKRNAARNSTDLGSAHFDDETEALVHKIYGHDFELMETAGASKK